MYRLAYSLAAGSTLSAITVQIFTVSVGNQIDYDRPLLTGPRTVPEHRSSVTAPLTTDYESSPGPYPSVCATAPTGTEVAAGPVPDHGPDATSLFPGTASGAGQVK